MSPAFKITLWIAIVFLIIIGLGLLMCGAITAIFDGEEPRPAAGVEIQKDMTLPHNNSVTASEPIERYFENEIYRLTTSRVGHPIEGFDAEVLMLAFPPLVPSDFNGVTAYEGTYAVYDDEVTFIADADSFPSTAERTLSQHGYMMLLTNIARRLGIHITDRESVDAVLYYLSAESMMR